MNRIMYAVERVETECLLNSQQVIIAKASDVPLLAVSERLSAFRDSGAKVVDGYALPLRRVGVFPHSRLTKRWKACGDPNPISNAISLIGMPSLKSW